VPAGAEILELGVPVGRRRTEQIGEEAGGGGPHLRSQECQYGRGPLILDGVDHVRRDVGERVVPRHRLELALTPFTDTLQRLGDTVL
jgi:hypothetical protein